MSRIPGRSRIHSPDGLRCRKAPGYYPPWFTIAL